VSSTFFCSRLKKVSMAAFVAGRADAAYGADEIVVVGQSAGLLGTELAAAV
jgi:hypothetical protein